MESILQLIKMSLYIKIVSYITKDDSGKFNIISHLFLKFSYNKFERTFQLRLVIY